MNKEENISWQLSFVLFFYYIRGIVKKCVEPLKTH